MLIQQFKFYHWVINIQNKLNSLFLKVFPEIPRVFTENNRLIQKNVGMILNHI